MRSSWTGIHGRSPSESGNAVWRWRLLAAASHSGRSRPWPRDCRPRDSSLLSARLLPEVPPHGGPHHAVRADLVLQVLDPHPPLEGLLGLRVPATVDGPRVVSGSLEEPLDEPRDLRGDRDDVLRILPREHRHVVQVEDPEELVDRPRVVVDPEVDPSVVEPAVSARLPDDEEGRGLLTAAVPARVLPRDEGREKLHGEVPDRGLERTGHPRHDPFPRQDVPLAGVPAAHDVARPRVALVSRVRGGPSPRVHDPNLTLCAFLVVRCEFDDRVRRTDAAPQEGEPPRAVRRVRVALRRDRADPRLREGDRVPHGRELRFHGDPEVLRLRIERDDAERHAGPSIRTGRNPPAGFEGSRQSSILAVLIRRLRTSMAAPTPPIHPPPLGLPPGSVRAILALVLCGS